MKNLNATKVKDERKLKGIDLGLLMIGYKHLVPKKKTVKTA
ncbi:hypothetical protein [Putridiphycobacter roseus]|nr:hypothetical protein [Putridiphycobacter roseus]